MLPSRLTAKLCALGLSPARAHQVAAAAIITQVPTAVVALLFGVSAITAAEWQHLAGARPNIGDYHRLFQELLGAVPQIARQAGV